MPNRRVIVAIAAVIALPIFFAVVGGGRDAGLAIGAALVAIGIGVGLFGGRG
jgi:hypothetical protein